MRGAALSTVMLALLAGCARSEPEPPVRVLAAASMEAALREVLEGADLGPVIIDCGASSALARRIEGGAPFDVFVSAHLEWMDRLDEAGLIDSTSRRDLVGNSLVVVTPRDRTFELPSLAELPGALPGGPAGRLALGDPAHVPAGVYARAALVVQGAWDELQGRIVSTQNVRAALRLVELGEVDAGIVYATDAASSDAVVAIAHIPAHRHPPIRYPVALATGAGDRARQVLARLVSSEAARVFEAHGFTRPDATSGAD